jgi:hypothetical protein
MGDDTLHDEEQHVQSLEEDRVDVEEIGGHDVGSLGSQELTLRRTRAPTSRTEMVVLHDLGDRARRRRTPSLMSYQDPGTTRFVSAAPT